VTIWIERLPGLPSGMKQISLRHFPGIAHECADYTNLPHPTLSASRVVRVVIERDNDRPATGNGKPPYAVPDMRKIMQGPCNGYRVASLFSGCGGSSLGYRMAGFKLVFANEFVPAAQASYRANFPKTKLDPRDIRAIAGEDVLRAARLKAGELDILDGSPPCASFSTAGKLQEGWGKVKAYSDTRQRTDDLFFEYVRLLRSIRPRVFVAENVSGLVKGVGKGYFLEVLGEFKSAGYRVAARTLDAQWLGVPQARERLIFVGVREDLRIEPAHPKPLPYRYSVREALPWLDRAKVRTKDGDRAPDRPAPTVLTHGRRKTTSELTVVEPDADMRRYSVGRELDKLGQGETSDKYFQLVRAALDAPSPTITVEGKKAHAASVAHPTECRKFSIAELRRICGFPDDFILTGTYAQQWERLGRAVPPPMMAAIAATIRDKILRPADER
jgi:DNA (cytosine-5)-methyltransferase 1